MIRTDWWAWNVAPLGVHIGVNIEGIAALVGLCSLEIFSLILNRSLFLFDIECSGVWFGTWSV
jgi:hypothetical protein